MPKIEGIPFALQPMVQRNIDVQLLDTPSLAQRKSEDEAIAALGVCGDLGFDCLPVAVRGYERLRCQINLDDEEAIPFGYLMPIGPMSGLSL